MKSTEVELDAALFDTLSGEATPTLLFGPLIPPTETAAALQGLLDTANEVRSSVANGFRASISPDHAGMTALDSIIAGMWHDGWSPATGNLDLFVTHFGSLFADAALRLPNTEPVFRDPRIANDFSLWQPTKRAEYFPFHKALKALRAPSGESLAQLYAAIASPNVA